ncbi:unnamed protein product [Toxocara canis]|uniref:Uncharacterized protein n=1 Tax=Toxocara canis TaxID=6265 RepID=A0A3P7GKS5_TOXCA|nr:unnamed protein product [Toxocara canis]
MMDLKVHYVILPLIIAVVTHAEMEVGALPQLMATSACVHRVIQLTHLSNLPLGDSTNITNDYHSVELGKKNGL